MEIKNDNHSLHKIFISTGKWCFLLNEKQGLFICRGFDHKILKQFHKRDYYVLNVPFLSIKWGVFSN